MRSLRNQHIHAGRGPVQPTSRRRDIRRRWVTLALSITAVCACFLLSQNALHLSRAATDGIGGSGLDDVAINLTCIAPSRPSVPGALSTTSVLGPWLGSSGVLTVLLPRPGVPSEVIVGDRSGYLYRYREAATFVRQGVFADLRSRVTTWWNGSNFQELGFLAAAFHPNFTSNGEFYVYYTAPGTDPCCPIVARLSRFVSRDAGATLDLNSEDILLSVPHTTQFHKGAAIFFGDDGYLYIGLGDGGVRSTAQNLADLRGKMLRLDVDGASPYGIPADNPFVDTPGARPEVYARGFRNPWRWSFNRDTREIWLGDVGEQIWEEINRVVPGGNYGWPIREGAHCFQASTCSTAGLIDPVYEYRHAGSAAVVGGLFYAGTQISGLQGAYLFGDAISGQIFSLDYSEAGEVVVKQIGSTIGGIFSFASNGDNEVYVLSANRVYRVGLPAAVEPGTFRSDYRRLVVSILRTRRSLPRA
ncbi:MAG: PQQ-dependent sugar dehydrogenase [Gammaproteobacteria bacterium]|nr:PQQ-dependent sugar dehydrogenase [Gammaproteobacteria bacterium]